MERHLAAGSKRGMASKDFDPKAMRRPRHRAADRARKSLGGPRRKLKRDKGPARSCARGGEVGSSASEGFPGDRMRPQVAAFEVDSLHRGIHLGDEIDPREPHYRHVVTDSPHDVAASLAMKALEESMQGEVRCASVFLKAPRRHRRSLEDDAPP